MPPASLALSWCLLTLWTVTAAVFLEEELNETVICTNDQMQVIIPSAFFLNKEPPVYIWDLHLNDPECRGVEIGSDYVFSIKTNLTDCGTITASDDTHIMFTNSIRNNETDIITRNYVNITFGCRYPVNYMVQQPNGENMIRVDVRTITLNTEDGNFSVSMLLYKDEAYEDKWTTVPSLTLEDNIYVKVYMIPANLMLRVERCWATPNNDPYSNIQYTFIKDSCPVLENDQTLAVMRNGRGPEALFRIQMFKFVGSSYTDVFLHCNVQICHSTAGVCQPNCSGVEEQARKRRDVALSHTVSYGPIKRLQKTSDHTSLSVPSVETFVLAGLLVILILITGVFGRLWHKSRRSYPAREAQLTLSNIHHISEVAN
ncbi:pancreatic secretory granule membrane major glycoprotein GP2 [Astyanax mexicanus]|uniref:Pancreatic secretory granule membrane major glycoprotein GP2-like n=1 Tax=Astyanax mexicanus TaxID=7994 RepID=A0A8T2LFD3_ASTMX|nr:pancreatic secretory granule membrane major glycoprotein GP2 [Astyanax mexicanus]KAG9268682.1 pancreatic secretory granule membrane major glycoprotein GP2-like [Astyanax mexicanus]